MTEKSSIERFLRRRSFRFAGTRSCLVGVGIFVMIGGQASAFTAYVSNEKSNTISVIDTDKFAVVKTIRSEEHTSELQSLTNLVCRLLLEKKNKTHTAN